MRDDPLRPIINALIILNDRLMDVKRPCLIGSDMLKPLT